MKPTSPNRPRRVASLASITLAAGLAALAPRAAHAETSEPSPPPPPSGASTSAPVAAPTATTSSASEVGVRVEGSASLGAGATSTTTRAAPPTPFASEAPRDPRGRVADTPSDVAEKEEDSLRSERLLQGFRLGYSYVANSTVPVQTFEGQSIAQRVGMRTPSSFLIGYEAFYRMAGHSWLNVILVGNVMIGGLEQSKFFPTANALLGFELRNSFQLGVGVNLAPLKETYAHTVFAAGWTPRVGNFYVPIHFFFVPDVDGNHRMGVTTGVTW
jgi:hypothetical protein